MGETSASASNWELEWCWRVFPEAKGRFPIIRSNLLESLPGSSKAHNMASCERFFFIFPFLFTTRCRWKARNTPLSWAGAVILEDHVFAESVKWEEENQLFASLWEMGANSESYSKHLEAQALSNCLHWETSALAKQDLASEIYTKTKLIEFPFQCKKIGNSNCSYTKSYSHFCFWKAVMKARGMGRWSSFEHLVLSLLWARHLAHSLQWSPTIASTPYPQPCSRYYCYS